jgi:16S rRNA (adenine1518-N6/adenine1519-N6)-dimethyltransferase
VQLLHQDVLRCDFQALREPGRPFKVVGNIPYNITTPLTFRLLEREQRADVIVLMVQREVADRMLSAPGSRQYGALSVGVQTAAAAERLFQVPRGAFRPAPNVDSTVVRLRPRLPPQLDAREEADLRTLTRTAFSWRRKQLQRILRVAPAYRLDAAAVGALTGAGFPPAARPETLAPAEFVRLAAVLRQLGRPLRDDQGEAA